MNIRRIIHIYIIVTQFFFLVRSLYIYREYSSHGDMRQVLYYIITADRKSNKCNVRIQHLISNHQRKISPESNLEDICFFYIIHLVYITQTFIDFSPYVFMFVLTCRWDHFQWHLLIYNIHTINRELNIGHGHLPMPIIIIIETLSRTDFIILCRILNQNTNRHCTFFCKFE